MFKNIKTSPSSQDSHYEFYNSEFQQLVATEMSEREKLCTEGVGTNQPNPNDATSHLVGFSLLKVAHVASPSYITAEACIKSRKKKTIKEN